MKINYNCLPCLINQVVKVADITNANDRDILFRNVFAFLSETDFSKTNPEIIGSIFRLLKEHIGNDDPYKEIRDYYNKMFLSKLELFEEKINKSIYPLEEAVKYAVIGNIIDFNPIHNNRLEDIMKWFDDALKMTLRVNHIEQMLLDIKSSNTLLYLGDNCGEICLDKILIKKIKEYNPDIQIYFGVRGEPVVNDSIESDAFFVGIDQYAKIISNGDDSLGTVLTRTSEEFGHIYRKADIIIAKGQANYESLNEQTEKNIYFLLIAKCEVIAKYIGVETRSLLCMNTRI